MIGGYVDELSQKVHPCARLRRLVYKALIRLPDPTQLNSTQLASSVDLNRIGRVITLPD
jgi:hypothetical protein